MKVNETIVEKPIFEIDNNVLKYGHSAIQLKNVSHFEIAPLPKRHYPIWGILGVIASFVALILGIPMAGLWVIALLVFILILGAVYYYNSTRNDYLALNLNSGKTVFFSCDNSLFLYEAEKAMINNFNNHNGTYKIDFNNCSIQQLAETISNDNSGRNVTIHGSVTGDGISVNTGTSKNNIAIGTDASVNNTNQFMNDWENAEKIFHTLCSKYFENSTEYKCCRIAEGYCKTRNAAGLKSLIEKKKSIFQQICLQAASTGISEIIKKLIGIIL